MTDTRTVMDADPKRWTQEWVQWIRNRGFCSDMREWNRLCDLALEAAGTGELSRRMELFHPFAMKMSSYEPRSTKPIASCARVSRRIRRAKRTLATS